LAEEHWKILAPEAHQRNSSLLESIVENTIQIPRRKRESMHYLEALGCLANSFAQEISETEIFYYCVKDKKAIFPTMDKTCGGEHSAI
jgi:hypothetical protein